MKFSKIFYLYFSVCASPKLYVKSPSDNKKKKTWDLVGKLRNLKDVYMKKKIQRKYGKNDNLLACYGYDFHNADKTIRAANDRTYHLLKIMKKIVKILISSMPKF